MLDRSVGRTVWVSAIPFYCDQPVLRLKQNSDMLYTTIIYVFQKIFLHPWVLSTVFLVLAMALWRYFCLFCLSKSFLFALSKKSHYPFNNQCSHHIETSQLICRANQLTGLYMMGTLVVKRFKKCKSCINFLSLLVLTIFPMFQC